MLALTDVVVMGLLCEEAFMFCAAAPEVRLTFVGEEFVGLCCGESVRASRRGGDEDEYAFAVAEGAGG